MIYIVAKVHEFCVYEINERDRGSPAYLRLGQKPVNSLGDLVPFTNKVSSFVNFVVYEFIEEEKLNNKIERQVKG